MSSANSATICSGGTVNINLTSNVQSNYTWIATDNTNTTGESTTYQSTKTLSNTILNNTSVAQQITYTITPTAVVGGCSGSQTFTLTVNPAPVMTSAASASICSGQTLGIALSSDIASSYSWEAASDNPNTTGESLTAQSTGTINNSLTNNSSIVQLVYYTVTPTSSSGGCSGNPQSVSVTVKPVPVMSSAANAAICSGATVNIPLSASMASSYTWVAADNANTTGESLITQSTSTISNTIGNSSNTTQDVVYTVTPTANLGACSGSPQTVTVTVDPIPVMSSASSATICSDAIVNIPFSSNVASSYTWYATNNVNTTGELTSPQSGNALINSITNNSAVPQNVVFTVTPYTLSNNCAGTVQTVTVTVNPAPVLINNTNATICSGAGLNLSLISNVSATFSWQASDNTNTTGESTTAQTSTVISDVITNNSPYVQNVLYTVTPTSVNGGCVGGSQTISVLVNPPDNANFTYPSSTYCKSGTNPAAIISGLTGGSFSAGSGLVFANIYTGLINLSASSVGTYTVSYTTNSTCANTATFNLSITAPALATFSYAGSPYCSNANNPLPVFGTGASAGLFSANPSGLAFNSTSSGEINLTTSTAGTYTVTNTIAAAGGCASDVATTVITINPLPLVSFSGLATNYFYNDPAVSLTGLPTGGTYSGTAISGNSFNPSVAGTGNHTITYSYTDANGCSNSITHSTSIVAQPAAPNICEVTVDSAGKYNQVYWEKTAYTNVDSFIVYRETGAGYQRIGAVSDTALSMFVDTVRALYFPNTGDPNAGTYRYKLQIRDSLGHYSPMSPYHNTIYFNKSFGTFTWNAYQIEGQPVPLPSNVLITYDLWRDDLSHGNWHQVNSVTGSQLTQTDIGWNATLEDSASWRVLTNWTIGCTPTRGAINTSRSNIKTARFMSGIAQVNQQVMVNLFPNPANNNVTVEVQDLNPQGTVLKLYNLMGEIVYQTEIKNTFTVIDASAFVSGMYTISIDTKNNRTIRKLVINH